MKCVHCGLDANPSEMRTTYRGMFGWHHHRRCPGQADNHVIDYRKGEFYRLRLRRALKQAGKRLEVRRV